MSEHLLADADLANMVVCIEHAADVDVDVSTQRLHLVEHERLHEGVGVVIGLFKDAPLLVMRNEFLKEAPPHGDKSELHDHHRKCGEHQDEGVDRLVPQERSTEQCERDHGREEIEHLVREPDSRLPRSRKLLNTLLQIVILLAAESRHVERGPMIVELALVGEPQRLVPLAAVEPVEPPEHHSEEQHTEQERNWPEKTALGDLRKRVVSSFELSHLTLNLIDDEARGLDGEIQEDGCGRRDDEPADRFLLAVSPAERKRVARCEKQRCNRVFQFVHLLPLFLV